MKIINKMKINKFLKKIIKIQKIFHSKMKKIIKKIKMNNIMNINR